MNELEATRTKLKCLEMVEGTGLNWWEVMRMKLRSTPFIAKPNLRYSDINSLEFALGIIEGKPVWEGDEIYNPHGFQCKAKISTYADRDYWKQCSWNPPKPKTVMVELLVEDVEYYANEQMLSLQKIESMINRRTEACRKALEEQK